MLLLLLPLALGTLWGGGENPDNLTPQEIIARFAEKETEFRELWEQYTYNQTITFEVLGPGGQVEERREMLIEVYFTNDGQRRFHVVRNRGDLHSVIVTPRDIENAVHLQPFVLTSADLADYSVSYVGEERVDELNTYVFDLEPRRMEKKEPRFQGRVWVDKLDLQIVMSRGKPVPESRHNKFPRFETVRQQVVDEYWFPVWTEADDYLDFGRGQRVHIRQLITYQDFKKFGVSASITFDKPDHYWP